jgi:hypothetical protein
MRRIPGFIGYRIPPPVRLLRCGLRGYVAAQVIRRILVTYARSRHAAKRGGGSTLLAFDESIALPDRKDVDLIRLDDALESLSRLDSQQARIIAFDRRHGRSFGNLDIHRESRVEFGAGVAAP